MMVELSVQITLTAHAGLASRDKKDAKWHIEELKRGERMEGEQERSKQFL